MFLFIHGFGSCGSGNKVTALRDHFGEAAILAPDLPRPPGEAMQFLEQLIGEHQPDLLIGSSLGGYYADWLNGRFHIPSVLINPATQPFETLSVHVGPYPDWCRGGSFDWKAEYLQELRNYQRRQPGSDERYLVLLQTGDEVLDYRLAAQRYGCYQLILEKGGNHRFENLHEYMDRIQDFSDAPTAAPA